MTGLESEATLDFALSAGAASGHGSSRFRSRFRNSVSDSARKKGGNGRGSRVGDLKSKSEILKKRSIKQAQESRRKVKRKTAAGKGQSTKRRKGQMK